MKVNKYPQLKKPFTLGVFIVLGVLATTTTQAATVSGGSLTISLDRNAVIAGVLKDTYPDTPTPQFSNLLPAFTLCGRVL